MKLEEIFELWEKDSVVDKTNLGDESLKISELHFKYYKIFIDEKIRLKKYEADMKVLRLDKYDFYVNGHNDDTIKKGWIQPAIGRILRNDVQMYLDADPDIIRLNLKIGIQDEKISLLESIIRTVSNRNFVIKNSIEYEKFKMGA